MVRNVVLSDTGGWLPQLLNTFDELGINAEESTMPADMRVIHCGDLIHKGAYSSQLLAIVTGLMVRNPGQWIQLLGNHEAQHLPGAPHFWSCDCSTDDIGLMNVLHRENMMLPTFAVADRATPFNVPGHPALARDESVMLFSHGGLTAGFWHDKTGGAEDVFTVAQRLNELPLSEVAAPGLLLGENVPPSRVGPVWAIGNTEVFSSWNEDSADMPFTQFHGHTTSYSYDWRKWWPGLEEFRKHAVLVPESRAVVADLNNNLMLGVDPGFSVGEPRIARQPYFEFFTRG